MGKTIPVQEASTQLEELVRRAASGEEVVIRIDTSTRARLIGVDDSEKREKRSQMVGAFRDDIEIADDFDEPLADSYWIGR